MKIVKYKYVMSYFYIIIDTIIISFFLHIYKQIKLLHSKSLLSYFNKEIYCKKNQIKLENNSKHIHIYIYIY